MRLLQLLVIHCCKRTNAVPVLSKAMRDRVFDRSRSLVAE